MSVRPSVRDLPTPAGMARAHLLRPSRVRGSLVLGHGAGGGIDAPDLVSLKSLTEEGWLVVRVEQPWRVAGRKVAAPARTLDLAWVAVLDQLTTGRWALPDPLVVGGRSAGARVACRTAAAVGADAVLALSFPLHPPGRPDRSRAHEAQLVTAAGTPLAVIQGQKDPFGSPEEVLEALGSSVHVFAARGAHSFSRDPEDVLDEARTWLDHLSPA